MARILITDSVTLNTGDAAILHGMLALIGDAVPQADIRIHCHGFDRVAKRYSTLPIRRALGECTRLFPPRYFWRWPIKTRYLFAAGRSPLNLLGRRVVLSGPEKDAIADYRWADIVVSCGGSFLTDSYGLDSVLAGYALGRALGKPMVALGQTLGPFADPANMALVGEALSHFALVAARDVRSGEIGREMALPEDILLVGADMAFNLSGPPPAPPQETLRPPSLGVSVRKWVYPGEGDPDARHRDYVARMAAALDLIIEQSGASLTFLSTCQGEPSYAYRDDEVAGEVVTAMRHASHATVDGSFNTPAQFMQKVSAMDGFIGTRMHSCILSMLAGVPAFNIEYEFKSRELYDRMGLSDLSAHILSFTPENLAKGAAILLDRSSDALTARMIEGVRRARAANAPIGERLALLVGDLGRA